MNPEAFGLAYRRRRSVPPILSGRPFQISVPAGLLWRLGPVALLFRETFLSIFSVHGG